MLINYFLALGAHVYLLRTTINGGRERTLEEVTKRKQTISELELEDPRYLAYAGRLAYVIVLLAEVIAWWNANQVFVANGADKSALIGTILFVWMVISLTFGKLKYRGSEGTKRLLLTPKPNSMHKSIFEIIIRGAVILMIFLV